ncbi:MAG TPA: PaaI family thioesterase [Acidobacteriota bacterium]|nr:PaaI family thioesterase [Acidobacteriota bacterium]
MYLGAPANAHFDPRIRIGEGTAEIRIEVRPEFMIATGSVHGALYFKALDDAAFFACNSLVTDRFLPTASFNIHLLRPVSDGELVATGTAVHRSRSLWLGEAQLVDGEGRPVARGSGSFMRGRTELSAKVGYV